MSSYGNSATFLLVLMNTIWEVGYGVRISKVYQIFDNNGTVATPNFPDKYPNYIIRIWNITVPSGRRIKLNFTSFHLDYSKTCASDFVRIQDGAEPTSDVIALLCGHLMPGTVFVSAGRHLGLHFETDNVFTDLGFIASYEAVALNKSGELEEGRLACQGQVKECSCFVIQNGRQQSPGWDHVNCSGRHLSSPPGGMSSTSVVLDLSNNDFTKIEESTFRRLSKLVVLTLTNNRIEKIANGSFENLPNLQNLDLSKNRLAHIREKMFQGMRGLQKLNLAENSIDMLHDNSFQGIKLLMELYLMGNKIINVNEKLLQSCIFLTTLNLAKNQLTHVHTKALRNNFFLQNLDLSHNNLTEFPSELVSWKDVLAVLKLGYNRIVEITQRQWIYLDNLRFLDLSNNGIERIHQQAFVGLTQVIVLLLENNRISYLTWGTLRFMIRLDYLDLSRNNISIIERHYFWYLKHLSFLNLAYNPVKVIEERAFLSTPDLRYLNLLNNTLDVLKPQVLLGPRDLQVELAPTEETLRYELKLGFRLSNMVSSSGYHCKHHGEHNNTCLPCPLGTYGGEQSNCLECPAGGFYQDEMAYYGELSYGVGCKLCPPGRFVPPTSAPAKALTECLLCPKGTNYTQHAGFKGCKCLPNFYRLDRFGPCISCPSTGLLCQNESVSLMPGFYWRWLSKKLRTSYQHFSADLLILNNSYKHPKFEENLPIVYLCPAAEEACLGGTESNCGVGYEGPLCAVCSKRYYQLVANCRACPEILWFILQVSGLVIMIFVLSTTIVVGKRRKTEAGRTVTDMILARLKIVISFYQVTSGTLNTFSYVAWPGALLTVMKYANIVQLNLLDLLPLHCFIDTFHVKAYTRLLFMLGLNVTIITVGLVVYQVQRLVLSRKNLPAEKLGKVLSSTKTQMYRFVCLLIFMTYPSTCVAALNLLPPNCHQICSNDEFESCQSFLRSDYSVQCFTAKHNKFVILDYFLLLHIAAVPGVFLFLLWKYHHSNLMCESRAQDYKGKEIAVGLSFLYENYSKQCWFWEIVELLRKVCVTSTLTLMGANTRGYLGATAITSGIYTILVAYFKPVRDACEHWLYLLSLLANFATMNVGMLLKIPAEKAFRVSEERDSMYITVILVTVNVAVIAIMAVNYISSLTTAINNLRRQPSCNVECCVTFIAVVSGASEDAAGMSNGELNNSVMSRGNL